MSTGKTSTCDEVRTRKQGRGSVLRVGLTLAVSVAHAVGGELLRRRAVKAKVRALAREEEERRMRRNVVRCLATWREHAALRRRRLRGLHLRLQSLVTARQRASLGSALAGWVAAVAAAAEARRRAREEEAVRRSLAAWAKHSAVMAAQGALVHARRGRCLRTALAGWLEVCAAEKAEREMAAAEARRREERAVRDAWQRCAGGVEALVQERTVGEYSKEAFEYTVEMQGWQYCPRTGQWSQGPGHYCDLWEVPRAALPLPPRDRAHPEGTARGAAFEAGFEHGLALRRGLPVHPPTHQSEAVEASYWAGLAEGKSVDDPASVLDWVSEPEEEWLEETAGPWDYWTTPLADTTAITSPTEEGEEGEEEGGEETALVAAPTAAPSRAKEGEEEEEGGEETALLAAPTAAPSRAEEGEEEEEEEGYRLQSSVRLNRVKAAMAVSDRRGACGGPNPPSAKARDRGWGILGLKRKRDDR